MGSVKLLGCLAILVSASGAMFAQDRELSLHQHPFLTFDVAGHTALSGRQRVGS